MCSLTLVLPGMAVYTRNTLTFNAYTHLFLHGNSTLPTPNVFLLECSKSNIVHAPPRLLMASSIFQSPDTFPGSSAGCSKCSPTHLRETCGQKCPQASGTGERPVQAVRAPRCVAITESASQNHGFGFRLYPWSSANRAAAGVRESIGASNHCKGGA